jgi:hypothetical protein
VTEPVPQLDDRLDAPNSERAKRVAQVVKPDGAQASALSRSDKPASESRPVHEVAAVSGKDQVIVARESLSAHAGIGVAGRARLLSPQSLQTRAQPGV